MKYPQNLVDTVWREHEAGMPSKETAKLWNLTVNQVRYVLKFKCPSRKVKSEVRSAKKEQTIVGDGNLEDRYYIDTDGNSQIETPESRLIDGFVKSIKDFYK